MITKLRIQGYDSDGEWSDTTIELEDATIDLTVDDGRWSLEVVDGTEGNLDISWQGGRAADRMMVRPVSVNNVVISVDRSRRMSYVRAPE